MEPPKVPDGERKGSLRTNLSFLRRLVRHATVLGGDTTTDLIARNPGLTAPDGSEPTLEAALATAIVQLLRESGQSGKSAGTEAHSEWTMIARREGLRP